MTRLIAVINGSMSQESTTGVLAKRVRDAVARQAEALGQQVEFANISVRELAVDVARVHVAGLPSAQLEDALDALARAHAVIAVTPTYAGSYAGMFKAFADLIGTRRLAGKPVLIGATGGTIRHSLMLDTAMRPLFSGMRALVLPTAVFAGPDDFGGQRSAVGQSSLSERVELAAQQLLQVGAGVSSEVAGGAGQRADAGVSPEAAGADPEDATSNLHFRPGKDATMRLLKSDGTAGTLRPDYTDFTPMGELLG